jgi:hypothetical protein
MRVTIGNGGRRFPLRRNRDFVLLQSGQLLSAAGSESTAIAYPLLVLALTQSPAKAAFFGPAAAGALRSVVPAVQLPDAAGVQQARTAAVLIAGPPVGGALFGLGRAVPFLADAISYAFSVVSLLLMRTPMQERRSVERPRVVEGLRFLWREPFLRTTTFLYGLANFIGPGVLLVVVVEHRAGDRAGRRRDDVPAGTSRGHFPDHDLPGTSFPTLAVAHRL